MMPTGRTVFDDAPVTGPTLAIPGGPRADSGGARIVAREKVSGSATFDANGEAEVVLGAPPIDGWWLLDRLVVTSTSTATTEARVYVGAADAANLADGTVDGNLDIAEYPRGLYVTGGSELRVVWSGGDPGATAQAIGQVAVERTAR